MEKINLTKREYVGEGYNLIYKNLQTGEIETFDCTKEEYEKVADKEGYVFISGNGGFIKVDSDTGMLSDGEFTIKDNKYLVCVTTSFGLPGILIIEEEEFNSKYIWQ